MLNKLKKLQADKQSEKGFTIIEVMIVLAIAGLIILIVFLAVPALQRNSRNTQRKSDIGRLSSAATTLVANLGSQPITATNFTSAALSTEVGNMGYYDFATTPTNLIAVVKTVAGAATPAATSVDQVKVVYNGRCSAGTAVYANKQVALIYATEGGGGSVTPNCVDQ